MHLEAHFGLSWLLAQASSDRRVRGMTVLAGILPDIDAVSYLFGPEAYIAWHHVAGHNLAASVLLSALAAWACRGRRLQAVILTQLAFHAHVLADMILTQYPVHFFWPLSNAEYLFPGAVWLGHPVNTALVYIALLVVIAAAFVWKRTPVELLHPELDRRLVRLFFERKTTSCEVCAKPANETCAGCGKTVCPRHGRIGSGFRVVCNDCGTKSGGNS